MKKYSGNSEVLQKYVACPGRTIIDVGCGNGDSVRWLAAQGARVIGLDNPEMLAKARSNPDGGKEEYVAGGAQQLPFADGFADAILYLASFHHVPVEAMAAAAQECRRVLKSGGSAFFVEPVYRAGAYSELTRLVEDEREVQKKAHETISTLAGSGLAMGKEEFFYMERSFGDYTHLCEFFVADATRRAAILVQARKITARFSAAAGMRFDAFRYRSICRLNILVKGGP
jgi:ubiquinone/menaquinone biosynthesis C-methylase UbiE